jgi:hypothetical protein
VPKRKEGDQQIGALLFKCWGGNQQISGPGKMLRSEGD